MSCPYGFRPGRSAHLALSDLRTAMMAMDGRWVIEVDIEGFFDNLDHGHLRGFLDLRVRDGVIRRVIDKWLKAGVLESGALRASKTGTPQGGVISPLLANIYLHHVVDLWWTNEVLPRLRGRAALVRYVGASGVGVSEGAPAGEAGRRRRSGDAGVSSRHTLPRRRWRGLRDSEEPVISLDTCWHDRPRPQSPSRGPGVLMV